MPHRCRRPGRRCGAPGGAQVRGRTALPKNWRIVSRRRPKPSPAPYPRTASLIQLGSRKSATSSVARSHTPKAWRPSCRAKRRKLSSADVYAGDRKIDRWARQHACVNVVFDDASAFANANTLEELRQLG
jgi:hypothetical protein